MRSLADFEFNKAPLCEGMILACEAIRRDFPSQDVYDELERLVSLAKEEISQLLPLEEQLEKLIALFYGDWGFKASRGVYRLSDALWLDQVLKNRQGSAVSLGAVLLWVANRLDLPLLPVIFPTQLILRIECPDGEIWLINPFNGESLSELRWKGMVIGASEGTEVKAIADGRVILADWLQGYGLVVVVEHGKGDMSLYGYNQSALVSVGSQVRAGQPIALVGSSGGQGRPSLYFEIRRQGQAVNPQPWLGR